MSNLKQSSVALLEEAIDRKIRNAQKGRDTTLATVTRIDSDGTTWVRVYGGAEETPVRRMTSSAQVGDVINVEGSGENAKATIKFRNVGVKKLILAYATYKIIE